MLKTTVKQFRVDKDNGLSFENTIPMYQKYLDGNGFDAQLPDSFADGAATIGLSRYYDLVIDLPAATEIPPDVKPNDAFNRRNDDDDDHDDGFGSLAATTTANDAPATPTSVTTEMVRIVIPTQTIREIIKELTGETLPRLPGEEKDGVQNPNASANLGYYLDGGLCAEWKVVEVG